MNLAGAAAETVVPVTGVPATGVPATGDPAAFTLQYTFPTGHNPDFVAYSHNGQFAAVTNGADDTISVYAVDCGTGYFTKITGSPFPTGMYPSSIAYSPYDSMAAVTNAGSAISPPSYSNDSITVYGVNTQTGALALIQILTHTTNPELVTPFSITYSPDGRFAAVANYDNIGSTDTIAVYSVSAITGLLTLSSTVFGAGTGPLTLAYSPNGRFAACTLNKVAKIAILQVDPATGILTPAFEYFTDGAPFGVAYSHSGKFLAIADRTANSVSTYTVDPATGALTATTIPTVSAGNAPSYLAYSSDDALLAVANTADGTVTVYCVDPVLGNVTQIEVVTNPPPTPVTITTGFEASGIQFAPCTDFAAFASFGAGTVSVYDVDSRVCP